VLLLVAVLVAATLTWILPAGDYERREDPATHRQVVVAGTYHVVPRTPVGPFAAVVAVPRGIGAAVEVVALVLIAGGAWVVAERVGTLKRLVEALLAALGGRGLVAIPIVSIFFAAMGALENMQEEIIPLVPVLLLLGRGLGIDAVSVVAMSAGAAVIGSAFGPTNPFQAGIAMQLAQLPATMAMAMRLAMLGLATALWIAWTMRHAARTRSAAMRDTTSGVPVGGDVRVGRSRDVLVLLLMTAPVVAYVFGSLHLDWGLNELSACFLVGGVAAAFVGGLGGRETLAAYLEGMQGLVPAAMMVGVARAVSLVLADGHVIDTILHTLAGPLGHRAPATAAMLMIPAQGLVHVAVSSVSGQAVLTLPVFVPLSDLLQLPRLATVLAYQMGAGLAELMTPTNGALMAVLLAAGVPLGRWLRFAIPGAVLALIVGVLGILATIG
jgi:uncharacterized ion transporter superfamily protein YfcC